MDWNIEFARETKDVLEKIIDLISQQQDEINYLKQKIDAREREEWTMKKKWKKKSRN